MSAIEILATGLTMPESPRYRDGEIWFVDGSAIRRWTRDARLETVTTLACPILLGLAFAPDGSLFTSDAIGRKVMRVAEDGEVRVQCDLGPYGKHWTNEISLLPNGALVVGQIGYDMVSGAEPAPSPLLYVAPDGAVRPVGSPLWFANGMASIGDGSAFLVAEFNRGAIWRFDFVADGTLADQAVVARDLGPGVDGIATRRDGAVAFANMISGDVGLLTADGQVKWRIPTGYRHATSVAFDPGGDALYVTALDTLPAPGKAPAASGALLRIAV